LKKLEFIHFPHGSSILIVSLSEAGWALGGQMDLSVRRQTNRACGARSLHCGRDDKPANAIGGQEETMPKKCERLADSVSQSLLTTLALLVSAF
jgi:hypothetical protein